jgi:hypothetical protein
VFERGLGDITIGDRSSIGGGALHLYSRGRHPHRQQCHAVVECNCNRQQFAFN